MVKDSDFVQLEQAALRESVDDGISEILVSWMHAIRFLRKHPITELEEAS